MKKMTLVGEVLCQVAPQIGARILMEPNWGIVGQITYKSGKRRYFRYSSLDLNNLGSSEISKDKDYACYFMKEMGYPVIEGKAFYSDEWAQTIKSKRGINQAYSYAKHLGFPVIVKPNSRSQGVAVSKVHNKNDFYRAIKLVFRKDKIALVQKCVIGRDYRVVVLDSKIISAYERIPLNVTGDGRSTIIGLLKRKQREFKKIGRDTQIKFDDFRIVMHLKQLGLSLKSVLSQGKQVSLLDNANLSAGGDSIDVTSKIHPSFKKLAIQLTKDMGLRLCGVDLMIDGGIEMPAKTTRHWVIEINSAPGLDHYGSIGKKQRDLVEDLYLEVLKAME